MVSKLAIIRKFHVQFGHVSSCVIWNVSAHTEITDLKFYVGWFYKICRKNSSSLKLGSNYMHITFQVPAETTVMDTKRYRLVANSTVLVYFFMRFICCISMENTNVIS